MGQQVRCTVRSPVLSKASLVVLGILGLNMVPGKAVSKPRPTVAHVVHCVLWHSLIHIHLCRFFITGFLCFLGPLPVPCVGGGGGVVGSTVGLDGVQR